MKLSRYKDALIPKEVLFVSLPSSGGLSHYANEFCNSLTKIYAKVTLLTLEPFEIAPKYRKYIVSSVSAKSARNKYERLTYKTLAFYKMIKHARNSKALILMINGYQSFYDLFSIYLIPANIETFVIQHEVQHRYKSVEISYFQRKFYRKVTYVIVHKNSNSKEILANNYGIRSKVLEINHGFYRSNIFGVMKPTLDKNGYILLIGSIRPDKGIEVLMDAYPGKVMSGGNQLRLMGKSIKGYTPLLINNQDRLTQNDILWKNEYVPLEKISENIFNATFLVFPFTKCTQSGSVRLAIFFEKPCIVTNVGELPDLVEKFDIGIVIPPGDSNALRDAIVKLGTEVDLRNKYIKNIKQLKNNRIFNWDVIISDMVGYTERTYFNEKA